MKKIPHFTSLRFSVEMTKPGDLFGVGESGRFAPTFSHPPFSQSPVTSKERSSLPRPFGD